ncbi:MAG TPA: hypothetical protein VEK76_12610 [Candidatus Binatia bacterium]|nr:hypothetical protein [Candidatus Binatia bacterium]
MEMGVHGVESQRSPAVRICARAGCGAPVKKPTNKYCSIRCCSTDPERLERLRSQAQRAHRAVVPITRQLSMDLDFWGNSLANPEAAIALVGDGREDVPRGMSRLAV